MGCGRPGSASSRGGIATFFFQAPSMASSCRETQRTRSAMRPQKNSLRVVGNLGGEERPMATPSRLMGAEIKRKEDPRLITGTSAYVGDITLPGLHHVAFVRAPNERDVVQPRERDVAHVGRGTSDEARIFFALDLRTHESGRRRHGRSSRPKFPTTRNEFFCGRIADRVRCVSRQEDAMLGAWKKKVAMPPREEALPGRPQPMPIVDRHAVSGHAIAPPYPEGLELAMFGLGCFWGAEKLFWKTAGVWTTAVGYAAGYTPNPTYEEVDRKSTRLN